MFPALRTLASSKLAWFRIATTLAPGAVATTHTRVVTDAEGTARTQQVVRQPRYVCTNGALTTGATVIKLHLGHVRRILATPTLAASLVPTEAGVPELPPLYTSGRALSQQRRVTDRTIRNHMQELKQLGLITRYQFRGRTHAYCVWINPDFVWETALAAPEGPKMQAKNPAFSSTKRKNFPLKEVLDSPLDTQNFEISQVEKLVTHREPTGPPETGNPLTGNAGPQRGAEPGPQASKEGAGGAGAARRAKFYGEAVAAGTGAKKAEALKITTATWHYVKTLIYRKVTFTEEAEAKAKNALWYGVFGGFTQGEPADWLRWLPGLQRRVELAAAWFQRNPDRWPPLPYAEHRPGTGYLDAENQRGFAGTEKWWRDEQARIAGGKQLKQRGALERAIDAAVAEMGQRQLLDAGGAGRAGRQLVASKRARQLALPELHHYHQVALRRLGGQEALLRFEARLHLRHLLQA